MKRFANITILLVVLSGFAFGQSNDLSIGLDASVLIGKVKKSPTGNIQSVLGLSPGLGIGYKKYFGNGASKDNFNMYWDIGTDVLILPFVGIGGDYIFDKEYNIYIGVNVTSRFVVLMLPIPSLNIGIYL